MTVAPGISSSGGTPVKLEVFEPTSTGPHPAILLLHGTFGLIPEYRPDIVSFADALVESGISVAMPHYLEATKSVPGVGLLAQIPTHLPTWKTACMDAFAMMAKDSRFEANHLGAIGFSLGGHLALSLAMAPPPGTAMKCVVDFFAPTRNPALASNYSVLPPVLILHGSADQLVPPAESEHLVAQLELAGKQKDRDYFFELYPGEGHGFKGPALTKSRGAAVEFIKKLLLS